MEVISNRLAMSPLAPLLAGVPPVATTVPLPDVRVMISVLVAVPLPLPLWDTAEVVLV